jgi:hypothetical protein
MCRYKRALFTNEALHRSYAGLARYSTNKAEQRNEIPLPTRTKRVCVRLVYVVAVPHNHCVVIDEVIESACGPPSPRPRQPISQRDTQELGLT